MKINKDMKINELLNDYLDYLEIEKNRSKKTRVNYKRYLECFLRFANISGPGEINQDLVRRFRLWLNRRPGPEGELKKTTQNYYLIALRNFLKYLAKRDMPTLAAEKIELGKSEERNISFLDSEELKRLLLSPEGESFKTLRDRAILATFFSTGLRVSELCALDIDSINLKTGEFSVRGKGSRIRLVFLSDEAIKIIHEYLAKRQDADQALFIRGKPGSRNPILFHKKPQKAAIGFSLPGKKEFSKEENLRLTPRSVERLMKYYAAKAGLVKKVTPHTLRHSFATDLLRNGADIRSVQALLGHSSINTTQIYTHITDKELRRIHKTFHNKKTLLR